MKQLMKVAVVLLFFGNSSLSPVNEIVQFENSRRSDGGYHFAYEAQDGSKREETGTLVQRSNAEPVLHVKGSFSYFDLNGRHFITHYEAGDKGTKTFGEFIPLPMISRTKSEPGLVKNSTIVSLRTNRTKFSTRN